MSLTPRQQRFVAEYLLDLNATQAAQHTGYSAATANREGSRLLSNAVIQEAIARAVAERAARTRMEADEVLLSLARIARARMTDYTSWGPGGVDLRPSAELSPEEAACVAEVSQTITEAGGSLRFKLHDRVKALELLGKHLGLFKDVLEHTFPEGVPLSPEDALAGRQKVEALRRERLNHHADNGTP